MKKQHIILLSALAVVSLAACTNGGASVAASSALLSSSATGRRAEMTIAHSSIPEGTNFYDGAKPTVLYYDKDGTSTDYTDYKNYTSYTITDSAGNTYGAGDALKAGSYTASATVNNRTANASFTVTPSSAETAAEGKGYQTIYQEDFAGKEVWKNDAMGALGDGKCPARGTPKILVIPTGFTDTTAFTTDEIDLVRKAYFGAASDTSWQSLSSYYKASSYGLLDIEGVVTTGYTYPETCVAFETAANKGSKGAADVVKAATDWYFTTYNPSAKRSDFDTDQDGYLDGVELVYKTNRPDVQDKGADVWWNYTSVVGSKANVATPSPRRYFWSEYKMISTAYYTTPSPTIDCHTLIHETGHLMGLNDYYSYEKTDAGAQTEAPAGCADMMDMNVGDHNAYSKMLYNWLRPKNGDKGLHLLNVDGSSNDFTITLNSFEDSGDAIVVRNTSKDPWNKSPYDEYLVLQYSTPTGMNASDSKGYGEWKTIQNSHGGTYEFPGLQVFHVDSRNGQQVGTYDTATKTITSSKWTYTDELRSTALYKEDGTFVGPSEALASNTKKSSSNGGSAYIVDGQLKTEAPYRELSAILSSGVNGLTSTSFYNLFGTQANLFGTKDYAASKSTTYGGDTYSNYKLRDFYANDLFFNDGSSFNWTFSVTAQTDSTCTLHFVNNEAIGK
jgi:M6 family metalloprotease-like protein